VGRRILGPVTDLPRPNIRRACQCTAEDGRLESRPLPQMRYVIGLSIVLGVLTWRSGDVQHGTDLVIQALAQLIR